MITVSSDVGIGSAVSPVVPQTFALASEPGSGGGSGGGDEPPGPIVTYEMAYRLWFKNVVSRLKWWSVRDFCLEDAAQETFVTAHSCWGKCNDVSKRKEWVLGLAKNTARNHVKSCRFGCRSARRAVGDVDVDTLPCPGAGNVGAETQEIFDRLLTLAVAVLSEKEHEVFTLYVVMDLTAKEVGSVMGVSEKSVYEVADAAKRKLTALWRKRHASDFLGALLVLQDAQEWPLERLELMEGVRQLTASNGPRIAPSSGTSDAFVRTPNVGNASREHGGVKPRLGIQLGWQAAVVAGLSVGLAVVAMLTAASVAPSLDSSSQPEAVDASSYAATMNVLPEVLGVGSAETWHVCSEKRVDRHHTGAGTGSTPAALGAVGDQTSSRSLPAPPGAGAGVTARSSEVEASSRSESDVELDRRRLVQVDRALRSGRPGDALALLADFKPRILVGHTKALEGIARCASGQTQAGRDLARVWGPRLDNRGLEQRLRNSCDLVDREGTGGVLGRASFAGSLGVQKALWLVAAREP